MAVIAAALVGDTVGKGAKGPLRIGGGASRKTAVILTVTGGTGYATGGVDISALISPFTSRPMQAFANARNGARLASVTISGATVKVVLYTAIGTEAANASDQTAAGVIDVLVIGQ